MNRKLATLVFAGLTLVAAGAWFVSQRSEPEDAGTGTRAKVAGLWRPGTTHRYRFEYRSVEEVRPLAEIGGDRVAAKDVFSASLHLAGELVLDAPLGEAAPINLRISTLEVAELSIGGTAVPDLAAILTRGGLDFQRGPRGTFAGYAPRDDADPLLVQTLRALGMRLQVASAESSTEAHFEIAETLPHGAARSIYTKQDERRWTRTRPRYESLDVTGEPSMVPEVQLSAEAKIAFATGGELDSVDDLESIAVASGGVEVLRGTSSLSLQRLASGALLAKAPPARPARPLSEVPTSDQLEKRLAAERTEGLTRAAAVEMLRRHMNGGTLPDHRRSLWRLTGLLENEPELARDLEKLLLDPAANSKGRALVLDVLVSVGHEEAQAAVVNALGAEVARADPSYSILYQRLGLIDEPTLETLRFARLELERARAGGGLDARMLSAYTAAAVAGHARRGDDPRMREDAAAVGTSVSALLSAAQSPIERAHLIKALSNVKDERFQAQIDAFRGSESDRVRQSVARAMREPPTADGLRTLLHLVRDRDPFVQTEAIRAMEKHVLQDSDWDLITKVIADRGLHARNHRILLDFVKYRRQSSHEATTRLLETMLGQKLEGEVAGAVRLLLAQSATSSASR